MLKWVGTDSRIYIRGHGDWKNQQVGDVDAFGWADKLMECGMSRARRISICACSAARDLESSSESRITESANSFASKFHEYLNTKFNWKTEIYARVYTVAVSRAWESSGLGAKDTKYKKEYSHKRSNSKLRFFWNGNIQTREFVDYIAVPDEMLAGVTVQDI